MNNFRTFLVALLSALSFSLSHAGEAEALVLARSGSLPIIITAPHGGSSAVPGVGMRSDGLTVQDKHTLEIAEALAKAVYERLGSHPYLVAALFSRKYIDANRKASMAFRDPEARPYYDAYHAKIRTYIDEIRRNHPDGALLVDLHGQGSDNRAIFRGTRHGSTVGNLLNRFGCPALTGEHSVFGILAAKGYKVIPENSPTDCLFEEDKYVGGFTVASYGSNNAKGIDAIQFELGETLRRSLAIAEDLADAIAVFYRKFLAIRKHAG